MSLSEPARRPVNNLETAVIDKTECGSVKLFHPRGPAVTIPVTVAALDYRAMLASVSAMLDAGFLVAAPGLEAGEHKEDIGYVVLRSKENSDGTSTPIVDLYPADDGMKFAVLSVYLNKPADEEAFEFAAKMRLDAFQPYIGAGKLERGASKQTDRLIVKAPKPFAVVFKDNPKYDPNETDTAKKKPKRLFVRWADEKPASEQPASQPPPAASTKASHVTPDHPAIVQSMLVSFTRASSRKVVDDLCSQIAANYKDGHLTDNDRACLLPAAQQALAKFAADKPAAGPTSMDVWHLCERLGDHEVSASSVVARVCGWFKSADLDSLTAVQLGTAKSRLESELAKFGVAVG